MATDTREAPAVVDRVGAVGVITLNRPHALNAVDAEMSAAVGAALHQLDADPEVRVCVITGAGRAFCAGADLKDMAAGLSFLAPEHPEWGFAGVVQHFVDTPLIAAVNGVALGGGTEIVLACDMAVMSEDARLGLPEVTRGIFAGAGGVLRLPDQIPPKIAAEAILTGEPISAATALRWGLVNTVTPPPEVFSTAMQLAQKVAANAPLAVAASKRVMARRRDFGSDWSSPMWAMNAAEFDAVFDSEDAREGTGAFAHKRIPDWKRR
ncbi:enoyl-CoA hydratase-related protein [Rhodococcus sp. NPDC057529]|uniref:enoyl-CoA hydratase-related protein n=1 Tax=Rhodococcus sp. NPDC057529 TaxID=3346158 RepID=UPI00366EDF18